MKRHEANPGAFARAFRLGQLYEKRRPITTAAIRELGASRATAKRDLRKVRQLTGGGTRHRGQKLVVQRCAHCGGHSLVALPHGADVPLSIVKAA